MADEIKKEAAKTSKSNPKAKKPKGNKGESSKKDGFFARAGKWFKRMGKSIAKFFKDEKGECKKIVWPDRKTVLKSTGVVLVIVTIFGLVLWLVDTGISEGIAALVNLAERVGDESETAATAGQIVSGLFGM